MYIHVRIRCTCARMLLYTDPSPQSVDADLSVVHSVYTYLYSKVIAQVLFPVLKVGRPVHILITNVGVHVYVVL